MFLWKETLTLAVLCSGMIPTQAMYSGVPGLKAQSRSWPFRNRSLGGAALEDGWSDVDAAASCGFSTYSAGVSACVKWLHPRSPVSTLVHNARNTRTSPGAQRAKHQKASAPANVHQAGGERVPLCAAHNRKKTDHSAKVESRRFLLNALINTMQIVPPDHFFASWSIVSMISFLWYREVHLERNSLAKGIKSSCQR